MRRPIGIVLVVAGVIVLAASALALAANNETKTTQYDQEIRRLVIENENGDVTVRTGDTQVKRTLHWNFLRPEYEEDVSDGTLFVRADCPSVPFNNCGVGLTVLVDEDVVVQMRSTNADMEAVGLSGESTSVATTNGDVTLTDLASTTVRATATNGDIEGDGLSGTMTAATTTNGDITLTDVSSTVVRATTTNSDIDVDLIARPDDLTLVSTNGDVEAEVPGGTYDISTRTTNGDVEISGLEDDTDSSRELSLTTTNGDIELRRD